VVSIRLSLTQEAFLELMQGTYNLWKGNSYAVSAAMAIGKVLAGVSRAVERGLDEDVSLYLNPVVFKDLK
jgi:hypothetical protein